jgi:hypothetical protein
MFNKNFYPTPDEAIELLVAGIDVRDKRVLEPSAGKGNIVDFLENHVRYGVKPKVDVLETETELQSILANKACQVVGSDFLTFNTHMEYDAILMNPPFDKADKHLLKAIALAENQMYRSCEVRCIVNAETIKNPHTKYRQTLAQKLSQYGADVTFHDNFFRYAERGTDVEVAIIRLKIEVVRETELLFAKIIDKLEQTEHEVTTQELSTYLVQHELEERVEDIKLYIQLYHQHALHVRQTYASSTKLAAYEAHLAEQLKKGVHTVSPLTHRETRTPHQAEEDLLRLRKDYWELILTTKEFTDTLTVKGRQDLTKRLEHASNLEITEENVLLLLQSVLENKGQMLKETLVDTFLKLTSEHMHEFSRNIHYFNGWKTNDAYKVVPKVIVSPYELYSSYYDYTKYSTDWKDMWELRHYVEDLIKALQLIEPQQISTEFVSNGDGTFENEWFLIKAHKKGTSHITFKNRDLLDRFNVFCGRELQWLPTSDEVNNDAAAKKYMKEKFPQIDEQAYDLIQLVHAGKEVVTSDQQNRTRLNKQMTLTDILQEDEYEME